MAIKCRHTNNPKIDFATVFKTIVNTEARRAQTLLIDFEDLGDWLRDNGRNDIKATGRAKSIGEANFESTIAKDSFDTSMLAAYASISFMAEYNLNLTRLDGSRGNGNGPVFLLDAAFAIVECLSAGRFRNAHVLYQQVQQLLDLRAYEDQDDYAETFANLANDPESDFIIPQRLPVFALEMMAQREGLTALPWESWDIAGDDAYIALARKVYTDNMDDAAEALCTLCNLHIQYSNPNPTGDADDALYGFEFDDMVKALWPVEIFAWLRLRQEKGLPLPEVEHPLLMQPLGTFSHPVPTQWDYEDWFVELVNALAKFHPRFASLPTLVFDTP